MTKSTTPRGLRNNNPLNIRRSSIAFIGLSNKQTDESFFQFVSIEMGYRAAMRIISTYYTHYGLHTIAGIIRRWAPESENDTRAYIDNVCKWSGLHAEARYNIVDMRVMVPLVAAMSRVENGVYADIDVVYKAYHLAFD
jgi:hypothetical protein